MKPPRNPRTSTTRGASTAAKRIWARKRTSRWWLRQGIKNADFVLFTSSSSHCLRDRGTKCGRQSAEDKVATTDL